MFVRRAGADIWLLHSHKVIFHLTGHEGIAPLILKFTHQQLAIIAGMEKSV